MKQTINNSWLRGPCIGRGAYGTVNAAVSADVFAVKSVAIAAAPPSHTAALENEIRILKSLSSPFIVEYLGDDTTAEGSPAMTFRNLHMEYLPSGTAADLSDSGEAAVASCAWCLVSALSYLHSRGIVHCDVKGRNVLLGNSPGSAKLADFGSAIEVSASTAPRGSPLWMAPEVMRGERQGPEADVWSVGCTVIEMVTGKPAWGAEAGSATAYRIGFSEELPLFPARLSSAGLDFLDKCLRRDYATRWSCDQLLQHPFLVMRSHLVANHRSPRCVLDCFFSSDFHEEEEEEEVGGDEDGEERIRGLVSGVGANWESSEGWLMVRLRGNGDEGTCSEYSDSIGASSAYRTPTLSTNSNLEFKANCNSSSCSCNSQCAKIVERFYCCSKCGLVLVYHLFHIFWNLITVCYVNRIRKFQLPKLNIVYKYMFYILM